MRANYPGPKAVIDLGFTKMEVSHNPYSFNRLKDYLAHVYGFNRMGGFDTTKMTALDLDLVKFLKFLTPLVTTMEMYTARPAGMVSEALSAIDHTDSATADLIDRIMLATKDLADEFDKDVHRAVSQYGLCLDAFRDMVADPSSSTIIAREAMTNLRSVERAAILS